MNLKMKSKQNGKKIAKHLEIIWKKQGDKKFNLSNKILEFDAQDVAENSMKKQHKNIYNFVQKNLKDDF